MVRATFKILCLLTINILLLLSSSALGMILSSGKNSEYVCDNLKTQFTYLLLVFNVGISIFVFVIVQNLNDIVLHRVQSSRDAEKKMEILWVLLFAVTSLYFCSQFPHIVRDFRRLFLTEIAITLTVIVFALQVLGLFIVYITHPDLFGLRFRRDLSLYAERVKTEGVSYPFDSSI